MLGLLMNDENEVPEKRKRRTYYPTDGFPKKLHSLLLQRGMRPPDLTVRLNEVRDSTTAEYGRFRVSAWLRGQNNPSPVALRDIAKALDVEEADIMSDQDVMLAGREANGTTNRSTALPDGRYHWHFDGKLPATKWMRLMAIMHEKEE